MTPTPMTPTQSNTQPSQDDQKQLAGMPVRSNLRAGIILQIDIPEGTVVEPEAQATTATPVV